MRALVATTLHSITSPAEPAPSRSHSITSLGTSARSPYNPACSHFHPVISPFNPGIRHFHPVISRPDLAISHSKPARSRLNPDVSHSPPDCSPSTRSTDHHTLTNPPKPSSPRRQGPSDSAVPRRPASPAETSHLKRSRPPEGGLPYPLRTRWIRPPPPAPACAAPAPSVRRFPGAARPARAQGRRA